ncbi:MAG: MarR family winged helix-turn-helix transcriptional regulator [Pseudonocardiaceae bacterium]
MSTAMQDDLQRGDQVDLSIEQWAAHWPELDVSALNVFGRVHRIFQMYQAQISRVFSDHGINTASFAVLAALCRTGAPYRLSVGALAEQTLVSTGGMTMRLDRLEQAGLITRERDHDDRRVVYAQLTTTGLGHARRVAEAHFGNESRLLHLLGHSEREQLAQLLRTLEKSIETAEG